MNLLPGNRLIRQRTRCPKRARKRLEVEHLDTRCLLSVTGMSSGLAPLLEVEPNDTLDRAQILGDFSLTPQVKLSGTIGNGTAAKADVDWSTFTLDQAAYVHLSVTGQNGAPSPILGLYNSDRYDFGDPLNPTGYRLLAQAEGGLDRALAAGTYYLALSGQGNPYFHPFLAGSGNDGQVGDYQLTVRAVDLGQQPTDGPIVLAADPGPGNTLDHSPLVLRIDFNTSLDAGWISPGQSVRLLYNTNGTFGDGNDQDVLLGSDNFSTTAQELQLVPAVPLKAGYYEVILAGDSSAGAPVLLDLNGVALGTDAAHPFGQDYSLTFQVKANEGQPPSAVADDTPAFAHDLGGLTAERLVQVSGVIGDDPSYDSSNPDPTLSNPSADVDMYHFHISGPGQYAFTAEVFAGRIGSPLDPGVSLFQMDPATRQLRFLDGNNNSRNPALATNGTLPLLEEPVLFSGLTEGDYYVAVSSNYNTPSSVEGGQPGTNGIFDPNVSHSGTAGFSTGPYVLNLGIHRDDVAPEVVTTNLAPGETLNAPPTELVVGFSETINLRKLVFHAYEQTAQETVSSVYVEGADGTRYFPRLESYDDAMNQAHFLMLDGLANGKYGLHLSGPSGLTDLAGNPLAGDEPGGDKVIHFEVGGVDRGLAGELASGFTVTPRSVGDQPLDLGVLFPHELQAGITVARDASWDQGQELPRVEDQYRFQVLQQQTYGFSLAGRDLPDGIKITSTDDAGNALTVSSSSDGRGVTVDLGPGTYRISIGGWDPSVSPSVGYQLRMGLIGSSDNPPPLVTGPTPALQLRLNGLPGSGAGDSTTSPVSPTPTYFSGGTGDLGGSTGRGATSSTSLPLVYGPTSAPGATGHSGEPASGPGTALAGSASPSLALPGVSPTGLIALSVSPVGSLHGNAEPSALATAQVAFTLPSQPTLAPSLAEALVGLVTTTKVLESEETPHPSDSLAEVPGVDMGGPALLFDEALKRVSESSPPLPGDGATVATIDPTSDDPPPGKEGLDPRAYDEALLAAELTLPERTSEEAAEVAPAEFRLSDVAWGAVLATIVSISHVVIKRYRSARCGPTAAFGRDQASKCTGGSAEPRPGLAGPMGARFRRPRRVKGLPWRSARTAKRGLSS